MGLSKQEFEKLADSSLLEEYEKLKKNVGRAAVNLAAAEEALEEFERDWKIEMAIDKRLERVMVPSTRRHFEAWLHRSVHDEDVGRVTGQVLRALEEEPDLVERNLSWEEIARRER